MREMKLLSLFLFFALFAHSECHAQDEIPVYEDSCPKEQSGIRKEIAKMTEITDSQITLFGKGIENRKTGDLISLSCIGTNPQYPCNCLKHVFLDHETKKSYSFGYPIAVMRLTKSESLEHAFKRTTKFLSKQYRIEARANITIGENSLKAVTWFVGMGGVSVAVAVLTPVGAIPVLMGITAYGGILGVSKLLLFNENVPIAGGHSTVVAALRDQDGWNWGSEAKAISNHHFEVYQSSVLSGTINGYNPQ